MSSSSALLISVHGISFLSFFHLLSPMPAPLLYTEIGADGIGDGSQHVFGVFLTDGGHEGHVVVLRDVAAVPVWGP